MHYIVRLAAGLVFETAVLIAVCASVSASASPSPTPPLDRTDDPCPNICTMIYQPVKCVFAGGESRSFGNACQAQAYACEHHLQMIGCVPRDTASAPTPAA
jgi:hypothetical protein